MGGAQVERQRRENRGAEEGGMWRWGVPLSTGSEVWGGGWPAPQNFCFNFFYYQKGVFVHSEQKGRRRKGQGALLPH